MTDQPPSDRHTPVKLDGYSGHVFGARPDRFHVFIYVPHGHDYADAEGPESRMRLLGISMVSVGLHSMIGYQRFRTSDPYRTFADATLAFVEIVHRLKQMEAADGARQ